MSMPSFGGFLRARCAMMLVGGIGAACVTGVAAGQMTYISQNRLICATAEEFGFGVGIPGSGPQRTAPDFGPFNESVSISVPVQSSPNPNVGFARQASSLLGSGIYFDGAASGQDNNPNSGVGQGYGYCLIDVQFTLASATPYSASFTEQGVTGIHGAYPGVAQLFAANNSVIFSQSPDQVNSGVLPAGSYRYRFEIAAGGSGIGTSSGNVAFTGSFSVPAPATVIMGGMALACFGTRRRHLHM